MKSTVMNGKVCIVTGASSGIGREASLQLADMGATVFMVVRDLVRGNLALQFVRERTASPHVRILRADLSSLKDVRQLVRSFQKQSQVLDVLVNNAAIVPPKAETSSDGYEMQFAVNHLSHFLLTLLLRKPLEKSGAGRVITVTSRLHEWGTLSGEKLGHPEEHYSRLRVYSDTKLANLLFTYELERRYGGRGVSFNAIHPGMVSTNIYRSLPGFLSFLITRFMKSPRRGADTLVYLASDPSVAGVSGRYFVDRRETPSSPLSHDVELAARLWSESESMVREYLSS